ncbi:ArsR/SmtB family transcription factor [Brachybacterium vulturis]|uniref:ArsR/SmtB family transcription factor n=1 Tax=Brachybacterium vulturis TaxID=2017484 RepID=UPI00373599EF
MDRARPLHVRASAEEVPDEALVAELRELLAQADGVEELAGRLALLSDPRRLQILFCLHAHPGVRSSDLASVLGAHESTTSHALAVLREAGWVRARRVGREVRYELAERSVHELLHDLGSPHLPGVHHPGEHAGEPPHGHD